MDSGDDGVVEDVFCDDIEVAGFQVPIFVRGGQRLKRTCGIPPNDKYVLRNIVIQKVRGADPRPAISPLK